MKRLYKLLPAVLLLAVASASWAACPEGYKSNYKGERLPVAGSETAGGPNALSSGSGWRFVRSLPDGAKKHGYRLVSTPAHPARYGTKSERFEVRPGDCSRRLGGWDDCKNDRERSELIVRLGGWKNSVTFSPDWSYWGSPCIVAPPLKEA
jgi:hypothetical protein